ncbi:MAG: hypothetical protein ACRC5M_01275 [Anaeroplasmataceae bacterium]
MNNYTDKIKKGIQKISSSEDDVVIIGDNSIGKTDIIYGYIKKSAKKIHFIDAHNKKFNIENIIIEKIQEVKIPLLQNVLETRLNKSVFNLCDSFSQTLLEIEQIYSFFKDDLIKLIELYLNKKIELKLEMIGKAPVIITKIGIFINNEKYENLSNGYQAIIRLFLEIIYANYLQAEEIIIDEVNEFLSPKNEENIFPFLKENFPNLRFIMTTHSPEFISSISEGILLIVDETFIEIQDLSEFETPNDIRKIYLNLFNNKKSESEKNAERIIRELLTKKKNKKLKESDFIECQKIDRSKLNPVLIKILDKLLKNR